MKIIMPCETVTRYILPALRVSISKKLFEKFKFNQSNIANILGVTQPVISKYLSENYDEKIKLILMPPFNFLVGRSITKSQKESLGPLFNNKLFNIPKLAIKFNV